MKHLLTLVAASVLALTACSGSGSSSPEADPTPTPSSSPPSSSPTPKPRPDPPPPPHACYRLGYDAALAPTLDRKAVPCGKPHSAVTFFVGRFGADMAVDLVNDGPVTFSIETRDGALVK